MPAYYAPRYEEFLQRLVGTTAVRAGLTDIAQSSRIFYIQAALARILDELSYATVQQAACWNIDTATGDDLSARAGELSAGTLSRRPANAATGQVVFFTSNPGATVTLPVGTAVGTTDGQTFETTATTTITPQNAPLLPGHVPGQDSGLVAVSARQPGAAGNVAAASITRLVQRPTGVDGVSNPSGTQFGQDAESDDALRARIRAYAASLARSTPSAIVGAVLGAQDAVTGARIADAKLVESETQVGASTLYIDDGFGQAASTVDVTDELLTQGFAGTDGQSAAGGETRLSLGELPIDPQVPPSLTSSIRGSLSVGADFAYDPLSGVITLSAPLSAGEQVRADYTAFSGLLALAQKIVDGDPSQPEAFPGYRAAGTRVTVTVPQVVSANVQAILAVSGAFDASAVHSQAQAVAVATINGLRIGEPVRCADLVAAMMGLAGVVNVTLVSPASDIVVGQGQLARTDASRVQVN